MYAMRANPRRRAVPSFIVLPALLAGCTAGNRPGGAEELARFEPSPPEIVDVMVDVAGIQKSDIVYDLGCGDGRIVITAAKKHGSRGVGLDIDPALVEQARENARKEGVENLVTFREEDILTADYSDATVVMLFLSERGNAKLAERLRGTLGPGTRIVSHCHAMEGWAPEKEVRAFANGKEHTVYLWTIRPAKLPENLAPFVPSPMPVVERMLQMAKVTKDDIVYDLGCGDGRIVVEAAKRYGARGVGIDYDMKRIEEAKERAAREGVTDRVEWRHQDILEADFSDATVVTIYLLPSSNERLRPKLEALKPGTRIVANDYGIGDWEPLEKDRVWVHERGHHVYLWRVGEKSPPK
jgi:ubiquinone/menaquinone biosynthesis C-methylase UbiE